MTGIALAANNGEVGGGEVMLLATARLLSELGNEVEVVGPDAPEGREGVLDLAEAEGYPVHRLSIDRRRYLHELRDWHGGRRDLLWCHGLVPAFATAGRPRRVVHLHKLPTRAQHAGYLTARSRSWLTLVPSRWMATRVPSARVLPNWTPDLGYAPRTAGEPRRLGYLGRHAVDKGLVVLADALTALDDATPVQLVLAGEPRFTDEAGARRVAEAMERLGGGAERVGWVDPVALLRDVDGLVVPSVVPGVLRAGRRRGDGGRGAVHRQRRRGPARGGRSRPPVGRAGRRRVGPRLGRGRLGRGAPGPADRTGP